MSSTNKTTNYNLNQYIGTDIQRRTDYNSDMLNIDTALKGLADNKGDKGIAYNNLENNVKVVQGIPQGGKMYLGADTQTGAIKIKLPKAKTNTMFKFRVKMNGHSTGGKQSNAEYIVKGLNTGGGFGIIPEVSADCQVTTIKDNSSLMNPTFYFCTGATEDYILIGEITDTHNYKSVVVDNVEIHHTGISDDWSKDWGISLATTLETLTSQYKVAVTPSLNATHLNGVQETITGEASKLLKFSTTANTILHILKIKKSDVKALRVAKDDDTEVFNIDTTNEVATGSAVSTTGAANKLLKFSTFANTILHIFKIKKTDTNALRVAKDDDTEVFNIDTANQVVTGSAVDTAKTANKLVKRDGTGDIAGVPNLSLITAQNDFIVGTGAGAVAKKTLAETKTILGINNVSNVESSTGQTANKIVQRDSSGNIAGVVNLNGTLVNVLASPNLNTLFSTGLYYCTTPSNSPTAKNGYCNVYAYTTGYVLQEYYNFDNSEMYTRVYNNNTWSSWKRVFQDEGTSLVANGYTKLSNGLIMQWGTIYLSTGNYTTGAVTFPVTFPSNCIRVITAMEVAQIQNGYSGQVASKDVTKTGFTAVSQISSGVPHYVNYMALGY